MEGNPNRNYLLGYLVIVILALLCLFFPFRVEVQPGGTYPTLLGVGTAKPYTDIKSGFEIPAVYIELALMFVTGSLMIFFGKRVFKILSLITLFFEAAYMFVLYVILTFHLDLFGPTKIVTAGTGYFLLLLVIILFTVFTIYIFVKTFRSNDVKKDDNDLLDDILTS